MTNQERGYLSCQKPLMTNHGGVISPKLNAGYFHTVDCYSCNQCERHSTCARMLC